MKIVTSVEKNKYAERVLPKIEMAWTETTNNNQDPFIPFSKDGFFFLIVTRIKNE